MQLLTKKPELTSSAFQCLRNLDFNLTKKGNVRMHLKSYKGKSRGSYVSDVEYCDMYYCLLTLKLPFTIGNDAPRGGICGDYIELSNRNCKKAILALQELMLPYPRKKRELAKQLSYMKALNYSDYNKDLVTNKHVIKVIGSV